MKLRDKIPPRSRELAAGVFQCSVNFHPDQLAPEDFLSEGLILPPALGTAVKKRQLDFLLGRYCSRICFENLGFLEGEVGYASDRSPIWPAGWIGSISHSQGHATAIVASSKDLLAVGIDVEHTIDKISPQMIQHICVDDDELKNVASALGLSQELALTLIFSSKESLYKAVHPLYRRFFGFHAAKVKPHAHGQLSIELISDLSQQFPRGRSWNILFEHVQGDNARIETIILDFPSSK